MGLFRNAHITSRESSRTTIVNTSFTTLFVVCLLVCLFLTRIDIDECVSGVHNCHSSASCTNTVGSFSCSCNHPYTGDGKTCNLVSGKPLTFILCCWEMLDMPYFRDIVKSNICYLRCSMIFFTFGIPNQNVGNWENGNAFKILASLRLTYVRQNKNKPNNKSSGLCRSMIACTGDPW